MLQEPGYTFARMTPLTLPRLLRRAAALFLLLLFALPPAFGWGADGHHMINRLAMESLPADAPVFLRAPEAVNEVEYLGPEPDRWRSPVEPEVNAAQAPEHFIDFEYANVIGPLPRRRMQFINALAEYRAAHPDTAAVETPDKVGLQPWQTNEVWERLKAAFREYRTQTAAHTDTKPVEAAILFYAGWLGHYVGDGSQPLHVSIQYNGWTGPNPHGYTTDHQIHGQFETQFVAANIKGADVRPFVAPVKPIGDEFDDYLAYLRHTGTYVEETYQLEKAGGFTGAGSAESRKFTEERIAAGASMLRDMIYAAWMKSAEPVPEYKPATPAGKLGL